MCLPKQKEQNQRGYLSIQKEVFFPYKVSHKPVMTTIIDQMAKSDQSHTLLKQILSTFIIFILH